MSMRGRACSREFKLEVVQQIASGAKRPAQVCREHHVAETVLLRWRREYEERGAAAFTPRDAAGRRARLAPSPLSSGWQSWSVSVANSPWRTRR
jgi:transposase-like protein